MCGRTSLFVPRADLEDRFGARTATEYEPRFNIAPGDSLEVITGESTDTIERYEWGLLPEWADDPDSGYINARAETAHEKPAFQDAWEARPCLVLSSGYYEWKGAVGTPKQPYRVYREDDPAFAMAGLWTEWNDGDDSSRRTVTILTTDPNETVESIHDRMPVVLPAQEEDTWLTASPRRRKDLCQPYPGDDLDTYPISTRVNDPANDDPQIIEPADTEQSDLGSFG
jgi:putative SOS response-associated peptidase YedK